MVFQNYPEWNRLQGAVIQIRRGGEVIAIGRVEHAMDDSSVLWIAANGIHSRRMYVAAEGYTAWVEPMLLCGDDAYRMTTSRLYG